MDDQYKFFQGVEFMKLKNYSSALNCFEEYIFSNPSDLSKLHKAKYFRIQINLSQKNYTKALNYLESLISENINLTEENFKQILYILELFKDKPKYEFYVNKYNQCFPNSKEAKKSLASLYYFKKQFEKCSELMKNLLTIYSDDLEIYKILIRSLNKLMEFDQCDEYLGKIKNLYMQKNITEYNIFCYSIYNNRYQYKKALNYIEHTLNLNKNKDKENEYKIYKYICLFDLQKFTDMINDSQELVNKIINEKTYQDYPKYTNLIFYYACAHRYIDQRYDYAEYIKYMRIYDKFKREDNETYLLEKAKYYLELGKKKEFIDYLDKSYQINSEYIPTIKFKIKYLEAIGNLEEAKKLEIENEKRIKLYDDRDYSDINFVDKELNKLIDLVKPNEKQVIEKSEISNYILDLKKSMSLIKNSQRQSELNCNSLRPQSNINLSDMNINYVSEMKSTIYIKKDQTENEYKNKNPVDNKNNSKIIDKNIKNVIRDNSSNYNIKERNINLKSKNPLLSSLHMENNELDDNCHKYIEQLQTNESDLSNNKYNFSILINPFESKIIKNEEDDDLIETMTKEQIQILKINPDSYESDNQVNKGQIQNFKKQENSKNENSISNQINQSNIIGKGGSATVYLISRGNDQYALKKINTLNFTQNQIRILRQDFIREVNIMKTLPEHNNIIKISNYDTDKMEIEMEYAKGGSLFNTLYHMKIIPTDFKLYLIKEIAKGLAHLHRSEIVHGDLKSLNILLDKPFIEGKEYPVPKITDFGISGKIGTKNTGVTYEYSSPEILINNKLMYESDVYSFATLVYEILFQKAPYSGLPEIYKIALIRKGIPPTLDKITNDERFNGLLHRCWSLNPMERPTMEEVVKELKTFDKIEIVSGYYGINNMSK